MKHPFKHKNALLALAALGAAAGLAACGGSDGDGAESPTLALKASCSSLGGMAIPASAIGLASSGAVVQSAATTTTVALGEFCQVKGIILPPAASPGPNMEFQVNLPTTWNRKALQMGGGGYDGTLVTGLDPFSLQPGDVAHPVKQGFVTLGSDGGHKGGAGFDGTFALNDQALLNYGKENVKKTHDAAVAVVKAAYGSAPNRFYFIGASQGGHEALDAAARYPDDYDGVVAHYPAYNVTMLHLGSLNAAKAGYANGGAGWMNATKTKLLTDAVYAACDTVALDGAVDGIISNVKGCQSAFDINTLLCPGGGDTGNTCLSQAQINAARQIASPYKPGFAIAGMDTFAPWPLLEGALFNVSNFGSSPTPSNPLSGSEALLYSVGDQTIKYFITRNATTDPMTFDPMAWQTRIAEVAATMDVTNISLEKFRAKGGKVIMTHGTADDFITPHNSVAYYDRQLQQFGTTSLDGFMRFYVVPGFGHGFGPFSAKVDGLGVLRDWVENGKAPQQLVATDGNTGATRSRPMCVYPAWPKFTGSNVNDAASFTCVTS